MISFSPTDRVRVHSAQCSKCGSTHVELIMEGDKNCLAITQGSEPRQICFGDMKILIKGYKCLKCHNEQYVTSYKELNSCGWYRLLGYLGEDYIGSFRVLKGHTIEESGFMVNDTYSLLSFNPRISITR